MYYEDYRIGERMEHGSHAVRREEILDFARQWDPQPFHVDEEAARASIFGGLTASSCHTFALMSLIYHRSVEMEGIVSNLGSESLRFPNPVRPGDEIRLVTETTAKRLSKSRPGIGIVTTRSLLINQKDEIVMDSVANFMARTRSG